MRLTKAWAVGTAEQAAVVFLVAFAAALGTGTVATLTTVHAAAIAGASAAVSFLQSAIATLVHPQSTNLLTALRTRKD